MKENWLSLAARRFSSWPLLLPAALLSCSDPGSGRAPSSDGVGSDASAHADSGHPSHGDSGAVLGDASTDQGHVGSGDGGGCDPFEIDASIDGPEGVYARYTCATLALCCPLLADPVDGSLAPYQGLCDDFVTYGSDIDCAGQELIYQGYGYCQGSCP